MIKIEGQEGEVMSPDGKTLYVGSQNIPYLVYVVDTATNTIRATVPDGNAGPANSLALSPDGNTLYVQVNQALVEVSTASDSIIGNIPSTYFGTISQLAVSPDGTSVYESDAFGTGLIRFDIAAGTTNQVAIGGHANSVAIAPGSSLLYLAQTFPTVLKEDPFTDQTTQSIGPVPATGALTVSSSGKVVGGVGSTETAITTESVVSLIATGTNNVKTVSVPGGLLPYPSLALNKDASLAFTPTSYQPFEIAVIDTAAGTLQQTIQVPGIVDPSGGFLAIEPDDSTLYALGGNGTGTLCSISLTLFQQTNCVSTFGSAYYVTRGIAISSDGSKLYLPTAVNTPNGVTSGITEYDAKSLAVMRTVSVGVDPSLLENSLVFSSGSNSVYVASIVISNTNPATGSLARIDLNTFTVAATQPLSYSPADVGVTPDGTSVLVVGSNNGTQRFDGTTLAPTGAIPGGKEVSVVVASH